MEEERDGELDTIKSLIQRFVLEMQGCKAVDLSAAVASELRGSIDHISDLFAHALHELIEEGEVIEICYFLPNMKYRVKSFLLPKGTHGIQVTQT